MCNKQKMGDGHYRGDGHYMTRGSACRITVRSFTEMIIVKIATLYDSVQKNMITIRNLPVDFFTRGIPQRGRALQCHNLFGFKRLDFYFKVVVGNFGLLGP